MDQGTHVFVIVRRDGSRHRVLIDAVDRERVEAAGPWHLDSAGRVQANVSGRPGHTVYLHRLVLNAQPGDPMIDHRNGRPLDNRRANLRSATPRVNGHNRATITGRGSSRYRGVVWRPRRQKWEARQGLDRRTVHVGHYDSEDAAAAALVLFRAEHGLGGY